MERLARALSIIQQGMLKNNLRHVIGSVNEATEVLGGMLNTHKCLLESWVEMQKRLESRHEKDGDLRDHVLRLWEIFQKIRLRVKKGNLSLTQEKTPKKGKGGPPPSYAQVAKSQAPTEEGDWQVVTRKSQQKK